ncbi:MAG: NADH-quinone oxidoreductase subunit N [bacterium]|nr:NADH-quinone oxidoreductase subunit N [bacterium]
MTAELSSFVSGWQAGWPAFLVGLTAFAVMFADLVSDGKDRDGLVIVGLIGLGITAAFSVSAWFGTGDPGGFQNTLRADRFGLFFTVVICAAAALTLLMSVEYLREHDLPAGDYHALVLLSTCGMVFMALANDLIVVFISLEVMSVGVYVLSGMLRGDKRSIEAAMKYFLLGAFASGFLLYGIAFFYGATGTTQLDGIAQVLARDGVGPMALLGIVLVTVGFGFKVALVPFQGWTPDVYEGAPTPVTAFMAVGVKAAAFAALVRVFATSLEAAAVDWTGILQVLAVLTMSVGNVAAIAQRSVKRMLAYSSIAHAGYALVGLVANSAEGGSAVLYYLAAYTAMNVGAFAVLIALGRRGEPNDDLDAMAGVGLRQPILGLSMTVFMLALAGFPPTAGFAGKFYLFSAAIDAGHVTLAIIGVLNSLVSVYYYLGVIVQMYMVEGTLVPVSPRSRPWLLWVIFASVVATFWLGVLPSGPMDAARAAFASLG